jgi:hypothetical protein
MRFVACINTNVGDISGDDLTIGRLYEVIAEEHGMLRLIDDSGEDYLYPASCFESITLAEPAAKRIHEALVRLAA